MVISEFIAEGGTGHEADWFAIAGPSCIGKSYFMKLHNFKAAKKVFNYADRQANREPTTWAHLHSIYCHESNKSSTVERERVRGHADDPRRSQISGEYYHLHWALTSDPIDWPSGWLELYNSKAITIKKRAIIIGVPYVIWRKRGEQRKSRNAARGKLWKEWPLGPAGEKPLDMAPKGEGFLHEQGTRYTFTEAATHHNFKQRYVNWITKLNYYNIPYVCVDSRNDYPILDESSFLKMLTEQCDDNITVSG